MVATVYTSNHMESGIYILQPELRIYQAFSRTIQWQIQGVPWVPWNPPFYRFARMRRRPHAHAHERSQKCSGQRNPPLSKS